MAKKQPQTEAQPQGDVAVPPQLDGAAQPDEASGVEYVEARALVDLPQYDAKCGRIAAIPSTDVAALEGCIDTSEAAVAYAKSLED